MAFANFVVYIWIQREILFLKMLQLLINRPFFSDLLILELYELYCINSMIHRIFNKAKNHHAQTTEHILL